MKAIFNGELMDFEQIKLSLNDRGFRYGDGLFETIAVVKKTPRFLGKHVNRIVRAADIFSLNVSEIQYDKLNEQCIKLIDTNEIINYGKIRISVWRKEGGLYEPSRSSINYLITVESILLQENVQIKKVDFSHDIINYPSKHSLFKTMSALKYVLAGLEKKRKELDAIIITDHNGFVSETLDSNIFMKKNNVYYTPPVSTGCIEGIMRGWIIEQFKLLKIPIEERFFIPNELMVADSVFTTNAMGVQQFSQIQNTNLEKDSVIEQLIASIS